MNIFFIVFSMLGLFLSRYDKFATNAKTILVLVSVVGITWQAELAFNGKDLPAIASAILSLSFASILATFLLGKRYIFPVIISTLALFIIAAKFGGTPAPAELDVWHNYFSIAVMLMMQSVILYIIKSALDRRTKALIERTQELESANDLITNEMKSRLARSTMKWMQLVESDNLQHKPELEIIFAEIETMFSIVGEYVVPRIAQAQPAEGRTYADIEKLSKKLKRKFSDNPYIIFSSKKTIKRYFYINETDLDFIVINLLDTVASLLPDKNITFGLNIYKHSLRINLIFDEKIEDDWQAGFYNINIGSKNALYTIKEKILANGGELFSDGANLLIQFQTPQKTILLFDDDPNYLGGLRILFNQIAGWEIHTYPHPQQWETILAGHQPELVFLDIDMPYLTGDKVVELASPLYPNTIFIAFTMNQDEQYKEFWKQLPFDGFIGKPIYIEDEFGEIIRELLTRTETNGNLWF